jgi:hypothetical protein
VRSSSSLPVRTGVWLAAACLVPGCSLLLVEGPRSVRAPHADACTTSRVVPAIDLAAGGALLIETSASAGAGSTITGRPGVAAALLGTSALLITSGVIGLRRVGQCQAALEAANRRQNLRPLEVAGRRGAGGDAWVAAGAPPEGAGSAPADAGADGGPGDAGVAP